MSKNSSTAADEEYVAENAILLLISKKLLTNTLEFVQKLSEPDFEKNVNKVLGKDFQACVAVLRDADALVGVVNRLVANSYISTTVESVDGLLLTAEGVRIVLSGSPEFNLLAAVDKCISEGKEATRTVIQAMKQKWVSLDKKTQEIAVSDAGKAWLKAGDATRQLLAQTAGGLKLAAPAAPAAVSDSAVDEYLAQEVRAVPDQRSKDERADKNHPVTGLVQRRLLKPLVIKSFVISQLRDSVKFEKSLDEFSPAMIASGDWKNYSYKPYNFNASGIRPKGGALHPLLKVREVYRQIFLEMGFQEMPTSRWVESSFWNFDALFQPQAHPARDAHDTFFVKEPNAATQLPEDYLKKVHRMHESGDEHSLGYRSPWLRSEAETLILRTHTTAVSARMLYKLAQKQPFEPTRCFSIDRVFRNETLDATHLAEFHQIEGWVADYNIALSDLIGVISEFFRKVGVDNIRFKPAFNPYTEPSMEIFGFHPKLNKWVELGNSGMFRPEMLLPMGFPEGVRVIAWGLGLERALMMNNVDKISDIRHLFGHKLSLDFVHSFSVVN